MTIKVQERISKLKARLNDDATVEVEKATYKRQLELLCSDAYSDEALDFFIENEIESSDEILIQFIKKVIPDLMISDGQNHFIIKQAFVRNRDHETDLKNVFSLLFGTSGYGKKIIFMGEGYTNTNNGRTKIDIGLWGYYNITTCDDSGWSTWDGANKDFNANYLLPHCKEILDKWNAFITPLTLQHEDKVKLSSII